MTVIDSSAIISAFRNEDDSEFFVLNFASLVDLKISAATYLETSIVLGKSKNPKTLEEFENFLSKFNVEIVAFDHEQALVARQAYRDFGKGSGHKAQLNFGDCFSYALAKTIREPILCKGNDFAQTDLKVICP